jgi:lipopolysaccharide transport protein LptA
MIFKKFLLLIFTSLYLFDCNVARAKAAATKNMPTRIRSDIIDIKRKSQTMDFFGNVVIERGSDSMLSEAMTVFYDEKKKSTLKPDENASSMDKSSINKIDAKGNVKIFSEEFIATGSSGYYDPKQEIFVLEKNVIVNNGVSIGSGEKFIYNLRSKKGNFVGKKDEASIAEDRRVVVIIGDDVKESRQKKSKNNSSVLP